MYRLKFILAILFLVFSYFSFPTSSVLAYYNYMFASVVLGQTDFTSQTCGIAADKFSCTGSTGIRGIFVAPNGKLIVSDTANNRVLIWNQIPTTNGQSADLVLGQADFVSGSANRGGSADASTLSNPVALWSDGTKLIIGDTNNNRALVWNSFPTTNGQSADVVIGQTTMSGTSTSCDADHVGNVYGIAVYNGKLVMANQNYNRVLIYNSIPTSNGASADTVIGQTDMITCTSGSISASTFSSPRGVTVSSDGKFAVADRGRHRILIWNSFPTSNGSSADVVVGQSSFITSNNAKTQSGLDWPAVAYISGDRLFISDTQNARVLIHNTIPASSGRNADIVVGAPNFTSSAADSACSVSVSCFDSTSSPIGMFVYNNKLIVGDGQASRVLIFDNLIREPLVSLGNTEAAPEGKLRMRGNVRLGEWRRYFLQGSNLTVSVNGGGFGRVSSLYGLREDAYDNLYEFFHEFEPGSGGYTLLFHAFSSNADEENAFYFSPFELKSITSGNLPTFTFSVNSKYWQNIIDNLDSYEVSVKKEGTDTWETYLTGIPVSPNTTNSAFLTTFDQTTGTITVRSNSKTLSGGKYQAKIIAVDKWGGRQETPSLEFTSTGLPSFKPTGNTIYNGWFPLQVNKISGVTSNILSSFNTAAIKTSYTSSTSNPTFSGVAYTDATVTLLVTNKNNTTQQRTYTAKATNSLWTLTPTLYSNSIIDLWVQMGDKYNELPTFQISVP